MMNDVISEQQKKAILENIIENRRNPIKWIRENIKIRDQAKGTVSFNLYDFQEKTLNLFLAKHFIVTLKSRQVGMSTLVQAFCIWSAIHYSNYNIQIISAGNRQATNFLAKMREMYELIPTDQFKPELLTDNKQTMTFSNGSKIVALPATRKAALGESINMLIIDEAAFIDNVSAVYQAAFPTLSRAFKSMKGKPFGIFVISTPNGTSGTGEWYYKLYTNAVSQQNKFVPVRIHWSEVPEYDDDWYYDQCAQSNWDYRIIMAELELSFVSSGDTYIPGPLLDSIQVVEPIDKSVDGNLWIFEPPTEDRNYVIGVDVGYGDRQDSSTVQVIDAYTLNQVAEYENNAITVNDFTHIVIGMCKKYNNALCNIERNAVGKVLIQNILEDSSGMGLRLYRDKQLKKDNNGQLHTIQQSEIGTLVSAQTRDIILSVMRNTLIERYVEAMDSIVDIDKATVEEAKSKFEMLFNKKSNIKKKVGIVKSERLINQFHDFINNKYGKPEGNHDDLVLAYSHALYCWANSKQMLLTNVTNLLGVNVLDNSKHDNKLKNMEFVKRNSDSKIWQNLSIEELQMIMDEEEEEIKKLQGNNEINIGNKNNKTAIESVYDALLSCV